MVVPKGIWHNSFQTLCWKSVPRGERGTSKTVTIPKKILIKLGNTLVQALGLLFWPDFGRFISQCLTFNKLHIQ